MQRAGKTSKGQLEDSKLTLSASQCCLGDSVSRCLPDPPKAVLRVSFEYIKKRSLPLPAHPPPSCLAHGPGSQHGVSGGHAAKLRNSSTLRVLRAARGPNWLSWRTWRLMMPPTTSHHPLPEKKACLIVHFRQENERDVTSHGAKTLVLNHLLRTDAAH